MEIFAILRLAWWAWGGLCWWIYSRWKILHSQVWNIQYSRRILHMQVIFSLHSSTQHRLWKLHNRLFIFQLFAETKIYPFYRSKDGCNGATSFRASNALFFVVTSMLTWMTSRYVLSTGWGCEIYYIPTT